MERIFLETLAFLDIKKNLVHQTCKGVSDFVTANVSATAFCTVAGKRDNDFFTIWICIMRFG